MDIHLDSLLNLPNATVESCTQQDNEAYLKLRLFNEESCCPKCEQFSSEGSSVSTVITFANQRSKLTAFPENC
jgi:hypothetical protein